MGFLSHSIPDQEWVKSVGPILEAAIDPATALSEAIRQQDIERQAEAIGAIVLRFPSLRESLQRTPAPTSAEARQAKKNMQLGLKDYIDGAKQGHKLFVDFQKSLLGRVMAGGMAGRAAVGRATFQETMYHEIVKTAEGRLEKARAFFEGAGKR